MVFLEAENMQSCLQMCCWEGGEMPFFVSVLPSGTSLWLFAPFQLCDANISHDAYNPGHRACSQGHGLLVYMNLTECDHRRKPNSKFSSCELWDLVEILLKQNAESTLINLLSMFLQQFFGVLTFHICKPFQTTDFKWGIALKRKVKISSWTCQISWFNKCKTLNEGFVLKNERSLITSPFPQAVSALMNPCFLTNKIFRQKTSNLLYMQTLLFASTSGSQ